MESDPPEAMNSKVAFGMRAGLILLALNVVISALLRKGHYLVNLRHFQFPAQDPFKPVMLLNGALVIAILLATRSGISQTEDTPHSLNSWMGRPGNLWFAVCLAAFAGAAYLPSLFINFWDHDWTHRHIGAQLTSWQAVADLFTRPQVDGMYRPLAFFSFLLDYRVFGTNLWGYHLQSIGLQMINSLLVWLVGSELGLGKSASRIGAVLFAVAAIHFEAVLWPAARFDLLACMFSLMSLLFFLEWRKTEGGKSLGFAVLSVAAFAVAALNKETGYGIVLLIPALIVTRKVWNLPALPVMKTAGYISAVGLTAGILIAIRFAIFHGPGGFAYDTSGAAVSHVGLKSIYMLVADVAGLSPFAVNSTYSAGLSGAVLVLYSAITVAMVYALKSVRSQTIPLLAGLAILSALPALPVMGWIRPTLQHTRHLYLPSVWIALMLGVALSRTPMKPALLALFIAAQLAGLEWNMWVYRQMFHKTETAAASVAQDIRTAGAGASAREVRLWKIPADPSGVWYFDTELQHQIEMANPGIPVRLCNSIAECGTPGEGTLMYSWDETGLRRQAKAL